MSSARALLDKAKGLLADASEENVLLAALRLRMCMEVLTYEKLKNYESRVPPGIQKKWQPPQAVRALLELEPEADQGFEVSISTTEITDLTNRAALDKAEWVSLGTHKTSSAKWLGKHYNKVGSYLHAKYLASDTFMAKEAGDYLSQVLADLEDVLSSTLWGSPFPVSTFACAVCGAVVARNSEELRKGKHAFCFSPTCKAEHRPLIAAGGEISLQLVSQTPPCMKCQQPMLVLAPSVQVGAAMRCASCGQVHLIVGLEWKYGMVEPASIASLQAN